MQNKLRLLLYNCLNKTVKEILTEESETYLQINDNLIFFGEADEHVPGGKENTGFLWTSEKSGFNHIYYYDIEGIQLRQITEGDWDVATIKGYEEKSQTIF